MKDKNGMPIGIVVDVLNGDVERALKKLKKKVNNDGIMQILKDKEGFIKPSEMNRRDKARAISRARKQASMENSDCYTQEYSEKLKN
jgi:ribosomal protein S21